MQKIHTSVGGYSIIAAIMMIGFLLILTTSTLNLVLQEMQDGRGRQDYMKAYAGAEAGMELALLGIKNNGYAYYKKEEDIDILGGGKKDASISYDSNSRQQSYSNTLERYETDIIPLFWTNDSGVESISGLTLSNTTDIHWNIVGTAGGISGVGNFQGTSTIQSKQLQALGGKETFILTSISVIDFLSSNHESYLILYNPTSGDLNYTLQVPGSEYFTHPRSTISSQAKVGKYTQNLETVVDNTEFLGILRYSIYSGD